MTDCASSELLDILCPMHLRLGTEGEILHAGPTIAKLRADPALEGRNFFDVFTVQRPRAIDGIAQLREAARTKLHLVLREPPHTAMKGIMVPLAEHEAMIVNLGFGISVVDAVRDFSLTNADFAATDLAIEMLYMMEAKTAAMEASRSLNQRLQGAKIAAEEQAFTDTLTGLKNRRAMDTVLARLISGGNPFAVMHIDLDFFKAVNDTLGHAAGDHVLQAVARIMVDETRSSDTVARVGGDEFTVILPDVQSEAVLRRVGRRIIDRIEEPVSFEGHNCRISASIGTVWIRSGSARSADEVLADADVALYASKRAGRAQQTFYRPDLRSFANATTPPAGRDRTA